MKKEYKTIEEGVAAYEDICSDARDVFGDIPSSQYEGVTHIEDAFEDWQVEEAERITKRYEDWCDALNLSSDEEWREFYRILPYCKEVGLARKISGDL